MGDRGAKLGTNGTTVREDVVEGVRRGKKRGTKGFSFSVQAKRFIVIGGFGNKIVQV